MLADAVYEQDQPVDCLPLQRGEIGTLLQVQGRRSELGPAPIKIDQITRSDLSSLLVLALFAIAHGTVHAERLMQAAVSGGVKKA
jgi:hypothetical protein